MDLHSLSIAIALLAFVVVVAVSAVVVLGHQKILSLTLIEPASEPLPSVSVIIPARNEAKHIEAALRSVLSLDYSPLEITVVNDRSTDDTGVILDRMADRFSQLNVVHVTDLPAGWLGKNYAMQFGADRSSGEWLLFSDADVFFEPSTLRRAIHFAMKEKLDHFTLFPETEMPTWWLRTLVVGFFIFLTIFIRPWKVRDPKSSAHMGVGAFNLIRAATYRAIEGHRPLAMRPDDDMKLGKLVKKLGYQQAVLDGVGLVRVPWYGSFREMLVGLEKNTFAVVEYNPLLTLASVVTMLICNVWPFVGLLLTSGAAWWLNLASSLILWFLAYGAATSMRSPASCAFAFPLSALVFAYIQMRSMFLTYWRGGIRWRDTLYPLAELRANRV